MKITRAKQPTPAPQAPGQAAPADDDMDDIDAGLNDLLFGIAQAQAAPPAAPAAPAAPAPAPVTVTEPQQKKKSEFVEEGDPLYVEIYERIMRERPQTSEYEAKMMTEIIANNPTLQRRSVTELFSPKLVTRVAPEHRHGAYKL